MVAFLKQLWLAKHAHIDLRRDLIRIFRAMLAIPAPDWLNLRAKVLEELLSRRRNVSTERDQIVPLPEQNEVVELQQRFETLAAEEVDIAVDDCIKKPVRREHVSPHRIGEVIAATIQHRIDCREMMLYIAQLILDASKVQA